MQRLILKYIWQVSTKLGHQERPKVVNVHFNRLIGYYYLKFCDSVSHQISDMVNPIFVKNMKGTGIISWRGTQ